MVRRSLFMFICVGLPTLGLAFVGEKSVRQNEDVQFIKQWQKDQLGKAVFEALALTQNQMDQLKAMRAEVDRIKSEYETPNQELVTEFETTAKVIRDKIEAGGSYESQDREALQAIRQSIGKNKRKERLEIGLAVLDLQELLTEEQTRALRETVVRHRGAAEGQEGRERTRSKRNASRGNGSFEQAEKGSNRRFSKQRRRGSQERRGLARILLSDSFQKNLG